MYFTYRYFFLCVKNVVYLWSLVGTHRYRYWHQVSGRYCAHILVLLLAKIHKYHFIALSLTLMYVMLLSQSNLCIQGAKHWDSEYRQMKEVRREWQTERRFRDRTQRDVTPTCRRGIECSPRVTLIFCQYKKPFSDWDVIQECTGAAAENLTWRKTKTKIIFFKN